MMVDLGSEDQAILVKAQIISGPCGTAWFKNQEDVKGLQSVLQRAGKSQSQSSGQYIPSPEEAKEMIKSCGSGWKAAQITDPFVRFYVSFGWSV